MHRMLKKFSAPSSPVHKADHAGWLGWGQTALMGFSGVSEGVCNPEQASVCRHAACFLVSCMAACVQGLVTCDGFRSDAF